MKRTRVLWILSAAALAAAIGAGAGLVVVSQRLDASKDRAAQLAEQNLAAEIDANTVRRDLEDAEKRIERLAELRRSDRHLQRERERAADASCLEEPGESSGDVRGPMRGDVDGNGLADDVYAVGLPLRHDTCTYHVAVRLDRDAIVMAPIRTARHATQPLDLRFALAPALFAELNASPGYEVVVQTGRGATGSGYQLLTMVDGELRTMQRRGRFGWSFGSTASAGGGTGLDCSGPGRIVEGRYGYSVTSKDHTVERRFYRVVGATLILDDIETYDLPYGRENRFPELARGDAVPFPSCENRIPRYRPPR